MKTQSELYGNAMKNKVYKSIHGRLQQNCLLNMSQQFNTVLYEALFTNLTKIRDILKVMCIL